jgi:uncharacterized RmlC-like cupin family protein
VSGEIRLIKPEHRTPGAATPGMVREEAISVEGLWAGFLRSPAAIVAGWHHHGEYETAIYVLSGRFQMEFGPGGRESFVAGPGDFIHVPPGAIHRERNPSDEEVQAVVVRAGRGEVIVNVDGPEE